MKVKALKSFISTVYGQVEAGEEFDCDGKLALQWKEAGMVEPVQSTYDTKVIKETPAVANIPLASGPDSESSSSPAAPASPAKTRRSSGKKTR